MIILFTQGHLSIDDPPPLFPFHKPDGITSDLDSRDAFLIKPASAIEIKAAVSGIKLDVPMFDDLFDKLTSQSRHPFPACCFFPFSFEFLVKGTGSKDSAV